MDRSRHLTHGLGSIRKIPGQDWSAQGDKAGTREEIIVILIQEIAGIGLLRNGERDGNVSSRIVLWRRYVVCYCDVCLRSRVAANHSRESL